MICRTSSPSLDPDHIPPHIRKAWQLLRQTEELEQELWDAFEEEFLEIYQNEELEKIITEQARAGEPPDF